VQYAAETRPAEPPGSRRRSAPAADRHRLLPGLGWNWLVTQAAIDNPDGRYREWRVLVVGFAAAAGGEAFVQNPFLLPASLLNGAPLPL